ncbi:B3GALT1 [Branchiostoma lanceolatum]|uniref:Hexosyltransferase n=1 Tax=Branchiostoma lanceolatum TaxID=7740 RepID=A0A8J9YTV8_BRALA|nr:B3GALT1 [Branchiostoma lanceolatum]
MDKIFSARTIVEKIVSAVRRGNILRPPILSCIIAVLFITICYEFFQVNQQVRTMEGTLIERESQQDGQQEASQRRLDLTAKIKNGVRNNKPILNPHPFTFTLNNPDKFTKAGHPGNLGDESNIPGVVIRTIFAVGVSDDAGIQQTLKNENETFGDVIQENFADSPRSLAIKQVMGLKWAFQFCPNAKYVMKVECNTFVNIFSLVKYLKRLRGAGSRRLVLGWVYNDSAPVRDPEGEDREWYVSMDDFPRETYPAYAGGFAFVMSSDMPRLLYEASLTTKYLFMDDIYVGICLEKLGIAPRHHGGFCHWDVEIDSCHYNWLIATRWVDSPEKTRRFWSAITSKCY